MIWPLVSPPVSVFAVSYANNDMAGFEPGNEETSLVSKIWKGLNNDLEAWTTPMRPGNRAVIPIDDDIKNAPKPLGPKPSTIDPVDDSVDKNERSDEKQSGKSDEKEAVANTELDPKTHSQESLAAPPQPMFNQLPDNERESVYSYENNLGSPKGQVEMDSPNRAVATRIRHRAGIANFSFGVPLASLSGRGIDAGAGVVYNSRTWNKSCSQYSGGNCTTDHYTYDVEQSWVAPGFSSGFGYLETTAIPVGSYNLYQITPTGITDVDGGRHQLVCSEYSGAACLSYTTNDGTLIKSSGQYLVTGLGGYTSSKFTVRYPNGAKVYYGTPFGSGNNRKHYPVIIQDSNGNHNNITYKSDQSGRIDYITDTLNRRIKFYYENDGIGNPDKLLAVTIPGMGTNDELQTVRFYYDTITLNSSGKFTGDITASSTIRVLKYVYMPATGNGYKYDHDTNYGMIKKITRYVGMTASSSSLTTTGSITSDGLFAASTEYNYPDGSTPLTDVPKYTKRTDDWQGRTSSTPQETFYNAPDSAPGADYYSNITVKDNGFDVLNQTISAPTGFLKETSVWKIIGGSSTLMSKTKYTWNTTTRNLTKIETTNDSGLTRAMEFTYDGYNNQTSQKEYDYAAPGSLGTLLRTTETTYETGSGWIAANLISLPKTVKTIVGGVTTAKTTLEYDHNGSDTTLTRRDDIDLWTHDKFYNPQYPAWIEEVCPESSGNGCITIHHYGYTPQSAYRGNVTKVTRFSDATLTTDTNADVSDYDYDIAGNRVTATLSCCNVKTITFDKANEYAFPVSESKGSSPQLTTSATYNRNTGLVLTSTNENSQVTNYEYEADTLRPKKTIYPNGGYAETEYSDKLVTNTNDLLPGFTRQTTTLDSTHTAQNYGYFNGRGDSLRSASQTPDGWLISVGEYDNLGRMKRSYNPFYGSTPTASLPSGQKFTEVTGIDALGRTTGITLQDNTSISTTFSDPGTVPSGFNRTWVSVTDQAGKQRRQIMDAIGRVVRVDEPDATGSLGAVDASLPVQQTSYEYDGNDNLAKVIQSDGTVTQERKFKYDSLSRLVAEKQVEASPTLDLYGTHGTANASKWTKVLKYNEHGLLTDGYDARGVHTQMAYDGLNRVSGVTYTGESGYQTPAVTYTYDQARSGFFNTGALTKVETAASVDAPATKTEFNYDLMGRVSKHRQWIGSQQYDLEYGYNLAGQLTSEKYPSGRIVTNSYDANGRLGSISDGSRTYLSSLQFQGVGGGLSSMTLGNGIVETFNYNDRGQMTQMAWSKNGSVINRYDYSFGQINTTTNTVDATKNNGQLAQVESYVGGTTSSPTKQYTQKFIYDSIGRLEKETEYRGDNGNQVYSQKFSYDRFGNRYLKPSENSANTLPHSNIEDNNIDRATNRLTTNTQTLYDEAGGVIRDDKFRTLDYGYDANGRMIKATVVEKNETDISVYDASGNKVATRVDEIWRFVIYNAFGKLVSEYGGVGYADEGGVKYVHSDIQGSARSITSNSGTVLARMDYQAFGEQIPANIGQRTAQGFSANDSLRQRYGLTERDESTGLDDTWWRKHENRAGRWTSPDPYNGSSSLGDPQSFNRYSYVENQPTNFVDPSGLNRAGPGTRYGPFSATGIAYYVDGMLSDARTVWSILGAGGGWLDYSNIGEISYATFGHYENDRWTRDYQYIWVNNDSLWSIGELIFAAQTIVYNAKDECAKLLGSDAASKFKAAINNIKFDANRFGGNSLVNGERIGDTIYLNPGGFAFSNVKFYGVAGSKVAKQAEKTNNLIAKELGQAASHFDYAVATVVHEFLHLIGTFKPDGNALDMSQSQKNQKKVLNACFPKANK